MSVQAIAWALSQETGSPSAKLVLVALANYADQFGICWPSQALLARQSEQSVDSIQRRLQELVERGFLEKKTRRRQSTLYHLLMPEVLKPQSAVSNMETNRTEIKIPQNQVKIPQLCGTEPLSRTPNSKKDIKELKKTGRGKPRHLQKTKDGKRLWCDKGTSEWSEYLKDYHKAHEGIDPPMQWDNSGAWFYLVGEPIELNGSRAMSAKQPYSA